jgi:hypothetical protein
MRRRRVERAIFQGNDGREYVVQTSYAYQLVRRPADPGDPGRWVPSARPDLHTEDGRVVDADGESGRAFRIRGTQVTLRPLWPLRHTGMKRDASD